MWPKQAMKVRSNHILLPMGRGNPSLKLPMQTKRIEAGACTLVWNNGYELHIVYEQADTPKVESEVNATIDLGQIHLAAVMTSNGKSLVVSGREIRAQKRQSDHENIQATGAMQSKIEKMAQNPTSKAKSH